MERWSGKVAVVTGASAGIGAALTLSLANHGLKVVGLARRPQLVDELVPKVTGKGSIVSRQCDLAKLKDIEETFEWIEKKFGGIDILINNAALLNFGNVTDQGGKALKDEDLLSMINVNITGLIMCSRKALASMKKRNFNGHIVNINSIAGHYMPLKPYFNIYTTTKHAVTSFTEVLLNELAEYKSQIKVTSVSPGLVRTTMTPGLEDHPALKPEEVADGIVYVLSTPPSVNIAEMTIEPTSEKKF